jgi:hypothetical protein
MLALPVATHARMAGAVRAGRPPPPIRLAAPAAPDAAPDPVGRLPIQVLRRPGHSPGIWNRATAMWAGRLRNAQAMPEGHGLVMPTRAHPGIVPSIGRGVPHPAPVAETPAPFPAASRSATALPDGLLPLPQAILRGPGDAAIGAASSAPLLIIRSAEAAGAREPPLSPRDAGPAMTHRIRGPDAIRPHSLPSAMDDLRGGVVRALAISAETRHPALPALPALRDRGHRPGQRRLVRPVHGSVGAPRARRGRGACPGRVAWPPGRAVVAEAGTGAPAVQTFGAQVDWKGWPTTAHPRRAAPSWCA